MDRTPFSFHQREITSRHVFMSKNQKSAQQDQLRVMGPAGFVVWRSTYFSALAVLLFQSWVELLYWVKI